MATLIESLTALAVFSIGASASATWFAQSTVQTQQAATRVRALALATDMESRLRANLAGVRAGDYQYAIPARFDCRTRGCSPAEMAATDLAVFHGDLLAALGEGAAGAVSCGERACLVQVRWQGGQLDWGVRP